MNYAGQTVYIPMGTGGLHSDDPQGLIPPTSLISALNISFGPGLIEKEQGSRRWNSSVLPAGIAAVYDWWPDEVTQRLIVVAKDGKVYRFTDAYNYSEVTPTGTAPATLNASVQTMIVAGGLEDASSDRKLFIFTGNDPVQVISGDGTTRANLAMPAADWSGANHPSFGIIHRSRLWVFGNKNDPHRAYGSLVTDHEDFVSTGLYQSSVYPGEGEKLFSAAVYKGRLFFFKYPHGVFLLDDSDATSSNWAINKLISSFGVASAHSAVQVLDDMLLANSTGSVTSIQAVQAFGDVATGDVLNKLRNERYVKTTTAQNANQDRHAIYYEDKKLAMFSYRSGGGTKNNRIMVMDFSSAPARVSWNDKDQPNCLSLKKDIYGVARPIYGADDGYIYEMDRPDRNVAGSAYTAEFQTPHMDFGFVDKTISETNKLFDFLEVVFEPTGNWDLNVEVLIDNSIVETIAFSSKYGAYLDAFTLDVDRLTPRVSRSLRKPLHGMGRRISFRCYNSTSGQNVKVLGLVIYFRLAGQQQRA